MTEDSKENVIEWLLGEKMVTMTLSQRKHIAKVKKMSESHPEDVKILKENADGTIFAKMPLSYLKLSAPRASNMTDEQRVAVAERLSRGRSSTAAQ